MSTPPTPPGGALPPLEAPPDFPVQYVNLARISHSPSELVFDFARLLPVSSGALVVSRIVMSPLAAKLFHRALSDNLAHFEAVFGEIHIPGDPSLADRLFRPPAPPAPPGPPDSA